MALTLRKCTRQKRFYECFQELSDICAEAKWGDPHSYARGREIYAACVLGHKVSDTLSGADGYDQEGNPVEYKSTIGKHCQGAYTGVSVKSTWEAQKEYLIKEKICKYPWHFYNRFDGGKLVESWKMSGQKVYEILLPKLKKKYEKLSTSTAADPRLAATVTWKEIKKHGSQVV